MSMMLKKGDVIGLVTVLGVLGVIVVFLLLAPKAPPQAVYAPVEVPGSALTVLPSGDQLAEVRVDAVLKAPGFVTFHRSIGGAPGPIVGTSRYLEAGEYSGFSISLDAPLVDGDDYVALLFTDDGDRVYESRIDLPVMVSGAVVKRDFSAGM